MFTLPFLARRAAGVSQAELSGQRLIDDADINVKSAEFPGGMKQQAAPAFLIRLIVSNLYPRMKMHFRITLQTKKKQCFYTINFKQDLLKIK